MNTQASPTYTVKMKVSELYLATSSAKTALAEGRANVHSWSAEWMSSITISATGMVASATIGPTGQIIVYGTEATSRAVVTLTPTVTTDDKLVWSCVQAGRRSTCRLRAVSLCHVTINSGPNCSAQKIQQR